MNHEKLGQEALADLSQKHRLNPFKHRFQHEAILSVGGLQPFNVVKFRCVVMKSKYIYLGGHPCIHKYPGSDTERLGVSQRGRSTVP